VDVGNGTIDGIEAISNKIGDVSHGRTGGISLMHDDLYAILKSSKSSSHLIRSQIDQVVRCGVFLNGPSFIELKKFIDHVKKKRRKA
jgi:hypothetical protein